MEFSIGNNGKSHKYVIKLAYQSNRKKKLVMLRLLMQMSVSLNDALKKKIGKMPLKRVFIYCQEQSV